MTTEAASVDPSTLKDVMQRRFGVCRKALDWLADFLSDRTQVIHACSRESIAATLVSGVPQGSVLGPKQFIQYAEDVTRLLQKHELLYHLFADDMQGMLHGPPADVSRIVSTITDCFTDVSHWCDAKRLQLNTRKTEVLWFLDLQPTCERFHQARASCVLVPVPSTQQLSSVTLELD